MRQPGSATAAPTVEELQAQLDAVRVENAALKAALARRRGGRPRDPARLALGERIHKWRQAGVIWYKIARDLKRSIRGVQVLCRDWRLRADK